MRRKILTNRCGFMHHEGWLERWLDWFHWILEAGCEHVCCIDKETRVTSDWGGETFSVVILRCVSCKKVWVRTHRVSEGG